MIVGKRCVVINCDGIAVAKGLCQTHYKRNLRHGTVDAGRPTDWGDRHSHPLYVTWKSLSRLSDELVCTEWKKDFWSFVADVKNKPSQSTRIQRIDKKQKFSSTNWFWQELDSSGDTADKRARQNERQKAYAKRIRENNKNYFKDRDLKRKYGITLDQWQQMHNEQGGLCKICGKPETKVDRRQNVVRSLSVDHCHITSKVRGLLCSDCNTAIGLLQHNVELLNKAIAYCNT
jgi:hypothetical protein